MHDHDPDKKNKKPRSRPFLVLLSQFWSLLRGFRPTMVQALIALTISTGLGLLPLYGTKIVFGQRASRTSAARASSALAADSYHASPSTHLRRGGHGADRRSVRSIWTLESMADHPLTKRLQVSVRKKVFDHAVRLPLHRVYELKSGGVASILREDAGGVADLIFSMIYNPSRAIIQLVGTLTILAFVDWRLLLGSIALLPTVWLTHRTWVGRNSPYFSCDSKHSTRHGFPRDRGLRRDACGSIFLSSDSRSGNFHP